MGSLVRLEQVGEKLLTNSIEEYEFEDAGLIMQAQATFKIHSARTIHISLFIQVNQLLQISKLNGTADDEIKPPTGTYIMSTALSVIIINGDRFVVSCEFLRS